MESTVIVEDSEFLQTSILKLEKEYNFWLQNRSVEVNGHKLNIYASDVNQPRPESYREDADDIKDLSASKIRKRCLQQSNYTI